MNVIVYVPELWQGEKYYEHLDKICFKCGELWWIGLTSAVGLLIGMLRAVYLPDTPAGFMQEALEQHVDAKQTPWIVFLTALALFGGGTVGPEAGLGSLGGAFGVLWAERRGIFFDWTKCGVKRLTRRERRLNTITGMCGALGSLLPSPYLSCLLIFELGGNNIFQHYMESIAHAGLASTASFIVLKLFAGKTFLPSMALPISGYDLENLEQGRLPPFKMTPYWQALILGMIAALLGMVILIAQGIFMGIAKRVHAVMGTKKAHVLLCTIAGIWVGVSAYFYPMTFGDGSSQLPSLINPKIGGKLPTHYFIGLIFAKTLVFGICTKFGYVGGFMFPVFFIGTALGGR